MQGVWVLKDGVVRFEAPPQKQQAAPLAVGRTNKKKALVYLPTSETVTSHEALQRLLLELGWERYYEEPGAVQFHHRRCAETIKLPADFARVTAVHMHDMVIKNRNHFKVVDVVRAKK